MSQDTENKLSNRDRERRFFSESGAVDRETPGADALLHAVADNMPQLAWMADADGHVDWFNKRWLDYTGTTLEQNTGAGWKSVHHPDYVDAVAEKFERHIREGMDWEDTFPLRGKDGTFRWFLSRMNVVRDETGKVVRFFGTNTDVSEHRAAQERLLANAETFSKIIVESGSWPPA